MVKKGNRSLVLIGVVFLVLLTLSITDTNPVSNLMDFGTRIKTDQKSILEKDKFISFDINVGKPNHLEIELLAGEHYWHPQMAIWLEKMNGDYISSLYVTHATAKGTFFGGRTKENFKNFDSEQSISGEFRRVDALPVWSHKRGVLQEDGLYAPSTVNPVSDAISGATISNSFRLKTSVDDLWEQLRLRVEVNVAFDDNEFYSEFDFPDDDTFHNGTGQLGQPSIVYETIIDLHNKHKKYYLMELVGHGHHSGQNGKIYAGLEKLSTAKEIVERILVKVTAKDKQ